MVDAIQARGAAPALAGIVYNTAMSRPDAALALAAAYIFENKREAKVASICVAGAGLDTAIYCDIVARAYVGPARNGNAMLAVGLPDVSPLPPDPPMVKGVVAAAKPTGEPQYARSIKRFSDTSLAEAVLLNGVLFNAESVMVLSGAATSMAKALNLYGAKDQFGRRVRRFVIVDAGEPERDVSALRKLVAEWPTPIVYCGPDVGAALAFPGDRLEPSFAWLSPHPVADAYRAFKPAPYDAPMHDVAALHYAVHPGSGFFELGGDGALTVSDDGRMSFVAGTGNVRRLSVNAARKTEAVNALAVAATAKPVAPARGRGGQ